MRVHPTSYIQLFTSHVQAPGPVSCGPLPCHFAGRCHPFWQAFAAFFIVGVLAHAQSGVHTLEQLGGSRIVVAPLILALVREVVLDDVL
jgi:hypothetical protein